MLGRKTAAAGFGVSLGSSFAAGFLLYGSGTKPQRMLSRPIILATLVIALAGCYSQQWDVQPVEGVTLDANTGRAVQGAKITNLETPGLTAVSDHDGRFVISGQSHWGMSMNLPASYLDRQSWVVTHPDYADAIAETHTLMPASRRFLTEPVIPLFASELPPSPEKCPYFSYLLRLATWRGNHEAATDQPYPMSTCRDSELTDKLTDQLRPKPNSRSSSAPRD